MVLWKILPTLSPHGTAQKTEIAKSVDIYELGKETDQEGYRKFVFPNIGKNIPMIICSGQFTISVTIRLNKSYGSKVNLHFQG